MNHCDAMGRQLFVGMHVVGNWAVDSTELVAYEIIGFTPQKVRLRRINKDRASGRFTYQDERWGLTLKQPAGLAIIEPLIIS